MLKMNEQYRYSASATYGTCYIHYFASTHSFRKISSPLSETNYRLKSHYRDANKIKCPSSLKPHRKIITVVCNLKKAVIRGIPGDRNLRAFNQLQGLPVIFLQGPGGLLGPTDPHFPLVWMVNKVQGGQNSL